MFICKAVKSLGVVYKPFSHGAARLVVSLLGFSQALFYTAMHCIGMVGLLRRQLSLGAHILRDLFGIN